MTDATRNSPWTRLVTGAALLSVGVIVWLDHLHRLDAGDYFQWWSIVLIAWGVANLPPRRWVAGAILIAIGIACLPHVPFFPRLRAAQLLGVWPLLISAGGVTLVMQALRPAMRDGSRLTAFHAIAVMGGNARTIAANGFVGGDAVAVMGGCDITLCPAPPGSETAIDILAFWGGVEIKVPRGWEVESHVVPLLGALVNNTSGAAGPNPPRLVIRGSAIMGGIEVRHPKELTV